MTLYFRDRCGAASLRHKNRARLQNSRYFCVFTYARAVNQKVWNEAENRERDWGETPYGRVRLARFARIRLLRHALPISLLILRKKPTVLPSKIVPPQPFLCVFRGPIRYDFRGTTKSCPVWHEHLSDMWLTTLEISAVQLCSVTEIAPKSLFLYVNRGPIRLGFRAGAKAIQ